MAGMKATGTYFKYLTTKLQSMLIAPDRLFKKGAEYDLEKYVRYQTVNVFTVV